jgi:DMSO reductase anchor subunit
MRAAWSVIIFTTLAGMGQGLFMALFAVDAAGAAPQEFIISGVMLSFGLLALGLAASFFHLGHPERAWRAAAMWRTSWLSREVIALPMFMGCVAAYGALHWLNLRAEALAIGALAAVACLALFVCTGMIYACLPFLQEWRTPLTLINFMGFGCASGLTATAALAAWLYPALTRPYVVAALLFGTVAYVTRLMALARNARLRPKSTLSSAIGIKQPNIVQITQGAMGGSFNTREFFHGRPKEVVRIVRWSFLALGLPVPALLLIVGAASFGAIFAALLCQYAGLLAERWYFFAEAKHPQNLYYQAIA